MAWENDTHKFKFQIPNGFSMVIKCRSNVDVSRFFFRALHVSSVLLLFFPFHSSAVCSDREVWFTKLVHCMINGSFVLYFVNLGERVSIFTHYAYVHTLTLTSLFMHEHLFVYTTFFFVVVSTYPFLFSQHKSNRIIQFLI